ncbi:hypothetical protein AWB67_06699 [Caballeronia terrestris]|uniref:Uncharacterized protein n=1 Tax=Caballeronia terrestris TaxID=1226301 RepID=A0A158KUW3_9BURK|nr:hypothetical protein AWB67_06699 [Caballeronia terrestris]
MTGWVEPSSAAHWASEPRARGISRVGEADEKFGFVDSYLRMLGAQRKARTPAG